MPRCGSACLPARPRLPLAAPCIPVLALSLRPTVHSLLAPLASAAARTSRLMRLQPSWASASRWRSSQPSEPRRVQGCRPNLPPCDGCNGVSGDCGCACITLGLPAARGYASTICPVTQSSAQGHGRHCAVPGCPGSPARGDAPLKGRPGALPGGTPPQGGQPRSAALCLGRSAMLPLHAASG